MYTVTVTTPSGYEEENGISTRAQKYHDQYDALSTFVLLCTVLYCLYYVLYCLYSSIAIFYFPVLLYPPHTPPPSRPTARTWLTKAGELLLQTQGEVFFHLEAPLMVINTLQIPMGAQNIRVSVQQPPQHLDGQPRLHQATVAGPARRCQHPKGVVRYAWVPE